MKFWDSSGIVPLLVTQSTTARLLDLYREDSALAAWWGSRTECDSAVARLEREGALTTAETTRALKRLTSLSGRWREVQPLPELRDIARRYLRTHPLRAGDALQLAAAFVVAERQPESLEFVCLDDRLSVAAEREGFPVIRV